MPVREHRLWTRTLDRHTRADILEICDQKNVSATARDNTGQNRDKRHILSPRMEIKISDPTGNRNPAAGLEGTYSIRVTIMCNFLHSPLYELEVVHHGSNSTLQETYYFYCNTEFDSKLNKLLLKLLNSPTG